MDSDSPVVERERAESDEPRGAGRLGCDPHLIDILRCKAQGVAAQAAYNQSYEADLITAQITYDSTRKAYRTQRYGLAVQVQDMRHQVNHLIDQVKCLIEERVVRCLDEAWERVVEQLEDCGGVTGRRVEELCEFDVDLDRDDENYYHRLVHRITEYQRRADEAKTCFDDLVKEPGALADRVIAYKGEVESVSSDLSADLATIDLKEVYARALVANRHIALVWNGFDATNEFVECLCRALTCWIKGCAAVSILTGAKAVEDCKRDARAKRCDSLKNNTVDEILALYDNICAPRCEDEDDEYDHDRDDRDRDRHHDHDHNRDRDRDRQQPD